MHLIERLAIAIAVFCLLAAAAGVIVGLRAVFDEPDQQAPPNPNQITDVRTYDVDKNGEPEFVEINGGVHAVVAPASPDRWSELTTAVATVVAATFTAVAALIFERLLAARSEREHRAASRDL